MRVLIRCPGTSREVAVLWPCACWVWLGEPAEPNTVDTAEALPMSAPGSDAEVGRCRGVMWWR